MNHLTPYNDYLNEGLSSSVREANMKRNKVRISKDTPELKPIVQGDYVLLYHGTTKKAMNSIINSGMIRSGTWFATDKETARKYALMKTNRPSEAIVNVFSLYLGSMTDNGYFTTQEDLYLRGGNYSPKGLDKKLDEGLMKALGKLATFALALPKLMQYMGFAAEAIGKNLDSPIGHQVAEFLVDHGKDLETKYKDGLSKVVGPMLKDPSKAESVTKDLIYALTAKNAGMAFTGKDNMYRDPKKSVMNVLDSIDQKNIADNVRKIYPNLVK
jgi:hypothetical protein